MSIISYNINNNIKNKWIEEYKALKQNLKDEELNLLKFFLVKNYHLNKVYKKYVYKEIVSNNSYYENNNKKIKSSLNDLVSYYSKLKLKNIQTNSSNLLIKKKKLFQNLITSIKAESNKKYELLLKEEKDLENDLQKIDPDAMVQYNKDVDDWTSEFKNNSNIMSNNNSIILDNNLTEYNKDEISSIVAFFDKKRQKNIKYRGFEKLKPYKSDNNFKSKFDSSKLNDNFNNSSTKSIQNLIGNLNLKKNNEKIIRLTSSQIPKKFMDIFDNSDDPIQNYFNIILKEINNINSFISNSNVNNNSSKVLNTYNPKNNVVYDENSMLNSINIFLNKIVEESKNINLLNTKIKYINTTIKEKMGGTYLGWGESEHNEFLILKNFYKDKINSYIFLTSLNNIFPYMNVSELKRHIKLYEIDTKVEKIKKLLIEKYIQMKNKYEIDKSRISKQTSTSVTKSSSSNKFKKNAFSKKYKMSIDLDTKKPLFFNTNTKFFKNNNNKEIYKNNSYLKTNFNKNYKKNNINRLKKNDIIFGYKKYSSISLNNSKDRILNNSCNMYKKEKIKKDILNLYNGKNGYNGYNK